MKVFLIAFRGTGGFNNPSYKDEPALIKAGHVGIQFEGDERIFGFHPSPQAESVAGGEEKITDLLKDHIPQPGIVQIDTLIFERAFHLARQGERTEVLALTYELPDDTFEKACQTLLQWYNIQKVFWYNFPPIEGSFKEDEYNCATFPQLLGLEIPSKDGVLHNYLNEMREQGAILWKPASSA